MNLTAGPELDERVCRMLGIGRDSELHYPAVSTDANEAVKAWQKFASTYCGQKKLEYCGNGNAWSWQSGQKYGHAPTFQLAVCAAVIAAREAK